MRWSGPPKANPPPGRVVAVIAWIAIVLVAALLYLFSLGVLCVPFTRPLHVGIRTASPAKIVLWRDQGRGFFEGDRIERDVPAGATASTFELRARVSGIRVELVSSDRAAELGALSLGEKALASQLDESRAVATVAKLPKATAGISIAGHLVSALLAVSIALVARRRAPALVRALVRASDLSERPVLNLAVIWSVFGAVVFVLRTAVDVFTMLIRAINDPPYWPLGVFDPAMADLRAGLAATTLLAVVVLVTYSSAVTPRRDFALLACGLASLVFTNLFHGWSSGYVTPTAGEPMYLADALRIQDVGAFLEGFTEHLRSLGLHARTHPPGAVLLYRALHDMGLGPGVTSLALGVTALLSTLFFLYGIAERHTTRASALTACVLFTFIPSVQVYFISSIDAVICATFTGAIFCFVSESRPVKYAGTTLFLTASMSLTFAAVFVMFVMVYYDLSVRRSARVSAIIFGAVFGIYALTRIATGFDWFAALLAVSRLENPGGFGLFTNPGGYVFTRLQGLLELVLFVTPVLALTFARALACFRPRAPLGTLSFAGPMAVAMMLAAGFYKFGETGRTCAFLCPLVALACAALVRREGSAPDRNERALVVALAAQSVTMQLAGDYFW